LNGIPASDTWRIWQRGGGLPEGRIESVFGRRDLLKMGGAVGKQLQLRHAELGRALDAHMVARYGDDATVRKAFPAYYPRIKTERALLLRAEDGTWFPLATVGPKGYLFLTEEEAQAAVRAVAPAPGEPGAERPPQTPQEAEAPLLEAGLLPPGGFAGQTLTTQINSGSGAAGEAVSTARTIGSGLAKAAASTAAILVAGKALEAGLNFFAAKKAAA
jgi:hypothetical protein